MENKIDMYEVLLHTMADDKTGDIKIQNFVFRVLMKNFLDKAPRDYAEFVEYVKNFSDCSIMDAEQFADLIFLEFVKENPNA